MQDRTKGIIEKNEEAANILGVENTVVHGRLLDSTQFSTVNHE